VSGKTNQFLSEFINKGGYMAWAEAAHDSWRETKASQGWTYGPERDNVRKTNPFMVSFADLPAEVQGLSSLTPYALVNFFRVTAGEKSLAELDGILAAVVTGSRSELLRQLAEYIHSHFIAAQLAKGETVETRDDLRIYEALDTETKSWDVQLALDMIEYLRQEIARQMG
jgi:hypothetical protein